MLAPKVYFLHQKYVISGKSCIFEHLCIIAAPFQGVLNPRLALY